MDDSCELFVLYKQFPSGGTIWLMLGMDTTGSDYDDIMAIAECVATVGHEVKVLHFVEYESYKTAQPKKAFRNMLHNGLAQSDNIILRHCHLSDGYMLRKIRGYIQNGTWISSILLFDGEKLRSLYKTEG